ncbi:PAS domain-containing protein, partial [Streptomyces sp. NPDC014894]|uniref:PAS domain-containing protein n=1 Tax=Streptomyces sp. NPDC014894 TaxID=3364931 RepID=UPI003704BA05
NDWSSSPLGWPETWPQALRSVASLMLGSRFPMFAAWGPDLAFVYNDAYAEILGDKHPAALGRRFREIWPEIWEAITPFVDSAMAGEATWAENLPFTMNRHGYDEQTTFTFSYSPIRNEDGTVGGMFCSCTETTARVRAGQDARARPRRGARAPRRDRHHHADRPARPGADRPDGLHVRADRRGHRHAGR